MLAVGIWGTTGRTCNATSVESDNCGILCCGRGFNTQSEQCYTESQSFAENAAGTLKMPCSSNNLGNMLLVAVTWERKQCECKFVWCCEVLCKTCSTR